MQAQAPDLAAHRCSGARGRQAGQVSRLSWGGRKTASRAAVDIGCSLFTLGSGSACQHLQARARTTEKFRVNEGTSLTVAELLSTWSCKDTVCSAGSFSFVCSEGWPALGQSTACHRQ